MRAWKNFRVVASQCSQPFLQTSHAVFRYLLDRATLCHLKPWVIGLHGKTVGQVASKEIHRQRPEHAPSRFRQLHVLQHPFGISQPVRYHGSIVGNADLVLDEWLLQIVEEKNLWRGFWQAFQVPLSIYCYTSFDSSNEPFLEVKGVVVLSALGIRDRLIFELSLDWDVLHQLHASPRVDGVPEVDHLEGVERLFGEQLTARVFLVLPKEHLLGHPDAHGVFDGALENDPGIVTFTPLLDGEMDLFTSFDALFAILQRSHEHTTGECVAFKGDFGRIRCHLL